MFPRQVSALMPTQAEITRGAQVYAEKVAIAKGDIDLHYQQLMEWLSNKANRASAPYFVVEDIVNCFHRDDRDNENDKSLARYEARRDDLRAINDALSGLGVSLLQERADANMAYKKPELIVAGVLMAVLAAVLVAVSVATLNPIAAFLALSAMFGTVAMVGYGAQKVNTEKSTFFRSLKETISPISTVTPLLDDVTMRFGDERLIYKRRY